MNLPETNKDKLCREFRDEAVKGIDAMMKLLANMKEEIIRTNVLHDNPPPVDDNGPTYCGTAFSYGWTEMLREGLEKVCYPLAKCNGATVVRVIPQNADVLAPAGEKTPTPKTDV